MKEPAVARRGTALVLVLGALLLAVTAIAAALAVQGDARRAGLLDAQERQARRLADDAEALACAWLAEHGAGLRTPLDDPWQGLLLLDDRHELDGVPVRVRLAVWDALGGVPVAHARRGAPLHQALPAAWRELELPSEPARADGATLLWELAEVPGGQRRYPPSPEPDAPLAQRPEPALALVLAATAGDRVNIMTAPETLIVAVARGLGRPVDLQRIARVRRDPQAAPPELPRPADAGTPHLVASSDRWQLRIEAAIGAQRFAWWAVVGAEAAGVQRLQRHAIDPD